MVLNGRLVQVARPTPDNSLALGMVGVAHLMWPRVDVGIPEMYVLVPESLADHQRFGGMLFAEGELEALP